MSIIAPEIHSALVQLLELLQTPDNTIRAQAELQLTTEWLGKQPDVLLMALAEQMQGSPEAKTRTYAAILFRRVSCRTRKVPIPGTNPLREDQKDLFWSLTIDQKIAIRSRLLSCLGEESLSHVRNRIGDAVAEIARQYSDNNEQWPELLGSLFGFSQAPDAGQRECAFRIFTATPTIIEKQHEDVILAAFTRAFKDEGVFIRIAAMGAFAAFFRSISKKSQKKYYPLLPEVLNVLPPLRDSGDTEQLSAALLALIELAEAAPAMFKPLFNNLVIFSVSVIQDKDLGDQSRQNALELMATFADTAAPMCRKDPKFASEMVTQCLSLMTEIGIDDDDAKEWLEAEDVDTDESDSNHVTGEQCMDRLATRLGGATLLPPTFNWLPRMITSATWRDRHAALMAISAISEGCRDLMIGELGKVLELVVPTLQDPHPRVRWAGCNALGQMSTDFATTMQEKFHQVVLSRLIPVLGSAEARVQSHAAAALVNFCEEAEKSTLEPYLDDLLSHLFRLLESEKLFVQEQALSTIATIADSSENAFGKYYDTLMPLLFSVLRQEAQKENRLLRAKAMECATLIALAVGKEKMGQDAVELVNILGNIQQSITDADDPQATYLLHCWGRMCRILGTDFLPYLPAVMPPLMLLASASADIELIEDEDEVRKYEGEEGWELVPIKGKTIGIKTSTLDDKNMAIELIAIYTEILQEHFEPYVPEIMEKIVVPGLAFFFHDPVRVSSAKCIPYLLTSYKKAHGVQSPQFQMLWAKTLKEILEILSAEPAIDTLAEMYQCFYESVEVVGKDCMGEEHMQAFIKSAKSTLEDYQTRVKQREEEEVENDELEGSDEDLLYAIDEDQSLLSDMNKAFHTIFKHHGPAFLQAWSLLLPFYDAFLTNPDPTNRQWALCIMDDVIEFCGEQSWTFSDHILQPLVQGMADDAAANRQAASYGVGVAAQKGGPAWSEFVASSIPALFQVCAHAHAREDDHVYATENACASIAKILRFNASKVANVQEVVNHWINTLPCTNDEEAAPHAYTFLAQLIDQQNPAVISPTSAPNIFTSIAKALDAETLQGQNAVRVIEAAKKLVQATSLDVNAIFSTWDPDMQRSVRGYFS
ncbi:MAG: hypothetical protein M1834_006874 [Cirrosporium novae-zelandiae]|nr:MAG: hypothetical protein M1834_006874 [Cirrosporium novae-zelandiae]